MRWLELIGLLTVLTVALFAVLGLLYVIFKQEAEAFVSPSSMPQLKPLPIPTKKHRYVMKVLVWLFEVRQWELLRDWHFKLPDETVIVLPRGFVFDGASIPRLFWFFLSPVGLLLIPGLIHDYGYKFDQLWERRADGEIVAYQPGAGKRYWDDLFRAVGAEINGFGIINLVAWFAVSAGGRWAWKRHRERNQSPGTPQFAV